MYYLLARELTRPLGDKKENLSQPVKPLVLFLVIIYLFIHFDDRVSLFNSCWLGTLYSDWAGFKFTDCFAFALSPENRNLRCVDHLGFVF